MWPLFIFFIVITIFREVNYLFYLLLMDVRFSSEIKSGEYEGQTIPQWSDAGVCNNAPREGLESTLN